MIDKMWIFVIVFLVILIPLVLGITIPIYKKHYNTTGGAVNYDTFMRKFVYKVYMSRDDIIRLLKTAKSTDEISCTIDLERSVIDFSEYGSHREYYYCIKESDGFSVIKLEQVDMVGMSSHIPLKLNPFMISKLQAEIVPFSQYSF